MANDKEYIAYKGKKYTVEWYFDLRGKSQALEYAETLAPVYKAKLQLLLEIIGDAGTIHNKTKFRNEGDKIYAFKPLPHRFLCFFFTGKKIIITNAFYKDQDKLPKSEKNRALKQKEDYEKRVKKGMYYD